MVDRVVILGVMFEIAEMISTYKKEVFDLEYRKMDLFSKVNELKLKYTIEASRDKELKSNEMREAKARELLMQDEEVKNIYKDITPISRRIDYLKIDIENLENKYKAHKYAFGSVVL
jgi:predicted RNase H-like nuclease (RuvC/YqgF family)